MIRRSLVLFTLLWCPPAFAAPVSVESLISGSLDQVPAVESARRTADAQAARVGIAKAPYYPRVDLNASAIRASGVAPAAPGGPAGDAGQAGLALHQLLYNFGQTAAQVDLAEALARVAAQQADARTVDAAAQIRLTYVQWAEARGLEAQALDQVRKAERLRDQASAFFRNGVRSRIDVTRAEVAVAQARAALVTARTAIEQSRRALAAALGGHEVDGEPFFPAVPAIAGQPLPRLEQAATDVHPSVGAARGRLGAAEATRIATERLGSAELNLDGLVAGRVRDTDYGPAWQAGLSLGLPVLTGGAIDAQRAAARQAEAAARADLADQVLQVKLAVDRAYLGVEGARARLSAFELARSAARETFSQAESRYRGGVGSIIEESDAQALLASAEGDVVRATSAYHQALAELVRASGHTGVEK
ncbi:MAG: efflux pump, family, outer membrane protein [Cyanobacteria bacterium RYN_339]|nr:efflux pump, family, outer membrane protein [Cyanobacteria bacterium RYN_339]